MRGLILGGGLLVISMIARVAIPALTGRPVSTYLVLDIAFPIFMGFGIASASDHGAKLRSSQDVSATRQRRPVRVRPETDGKKEQL